MARRCILVTAYLKSDIRALYAPQEGDLVLCADGGYAHAQKAGIAPHLVIGDLDSNVDVPIPPALLERVPVEKDDTDTMLCVRYALDTACDTCLILGGIGGRLDHTLANLQTLAFALDHGMRAELIGDHDRAFLLRDGACVLPREERSLSLLAFSERCLGLTTSGVKYPLTDHTLTQGWPMAVSNAFTAPEARISVREGTLLIVLSDFER